MCQRSIFTALAVPARSTRADVKAAKDKSALPRLTGKPTSFAKSRKSDKVLRLRSLAKLAIARGVLGMWGPSGSSKGAFTKM